MNILFRSLKLPLLTAPINDPTIVLIPYFLIQNALIPLKDITFTFEQASRSWLTDFIRIDFVDLSIQIQGFAN
uniref:Uncharacterized protein n=1 Tax=Lepeophtheirus salmonis TaxID=72036 RepID=A0A0K2VDB9_LEPSM